VLLLWGWARHCELHGVVLDKKPDETKKAYDIRSMPTWGLVEWMAYTCRRFRADRLLIENKASGKDVANEMNRLYREDGWIVQLVDPNRDKVTRAHAVEPAFAAGLVFAPDEEWAERFIEECEVFPKGKHDDRVDALTQGIKFLRENGLLQHNFEVAAEYREAAAHRSVEKALYDV
jgi:predicted phage terminase large subunit-like protein